MVGQGDLRLHHKRMLRLGQFDNGAVAANDAVTLEAAHAFQTWTRGEIYLLRELLIRNAAIPAQDFKDLMIDTVKPGFLFHRWDVQ